MLKEYGLNKLCNDFLMSFVETTVQNSTFQMEIDGEPLTVIALNANMTEEQLESYLSFILGV